MSRVTIIRPDDWHLHLRDGDHMRAVLPDTARRFARAIVMPNLKPPVTTTDMVRGYRERILSALPDGMKFEPLMTLYLTDNTTATKSGAPSKAAWFMPSNTIRPARPPIPDSGVTELGKCENALAAMEECGLPLLVHGEVTFPERRYFRPRKDFHRPRAGSGAAEIFKAARRVRAHHDQGGGAFRHGDAAAGRGDHHRAPSAAQPQRACLRAASARITTACRY